MDLLAKVGDVEHVEVVVRGELQEWESSHVSLWRVAPSTQERRIYLLPHLSVELRVLRQDKVFSNNRNVYVAPALVVINGLRPSNMMDGEGKSIAPYTVREDPSGVAQKWVKKVMYAVWECDGCTVVKGWKLDLSKEGCVDNFLVLSYRQGRVGCSGRCFLPFG